MWKSGFKHIDQHKKLMTFNFRTDTNNSFSDRQDSDDDSILDPEPVRLSFAGSESAEENRITSPHRKLCPQESLYLGRGSSSSLVSR